MAKNTGKDAEEEFVEHWTRLGKKAVVFPLYDAAYMRGLNKGKHVNAPKQPSDYLVTYDGHTHYAEVKSTENPTAFPFKMLRTNQWGAALKVMAASGHYRVYAKNMLTGAWYCIPAKFIQYRKEVGYESVKWDALHDFIWEC